MSDGDPQIRDPHSLATCAFAQPLGKSEGAEFVGWLREALSKCQNSPCCSVAKSHLTLCDPMDCSTPGLPVLHPLPEFAKTHIHQVGDAIQSSHPLSPSSPPALNLSQHQGLFQ